MKSRTINLVPPAAEGWAITYMETDRVTLQTANASVVAPGNTTGTIYAQIGIVTDVNYPQGVTATLAEGYMDLNHPISWDGRADLGNNTRLFLRAWIGTTAHLQLTAGYRMP